MNRKTAASATPLRGAVIISAGLFTLAGCATAPPWHFDTMRRQVVDGPLGSAVTAGDLPGVVVLVTTKDSILYPRAFGVLDPVAGRPIEPDAAFKIASMTKPITSVAAMMLVDEGKLSLDVPASRYLPELKGRAVLASVDSAHGTIVTRPANREVTVRDLLRHTSGIAYSFSTRPASRKRRAV